MANPTGKGGFGDRLHTINRKGRPKDFISLRQLAQNIALEPVLLKDGTKALINGKPLTTIERILREWARSSNPKMQLQFVEVAYGKVPTHEVDIDTGKMTLTIDMRPTPDESRN